MKSLGMFSVLPLFLLAVLLQFKAKAQTADESLQRLLQSYYSMKQGLVEGKTGVVSQGATSFVKILNGISYQLISEGNVHALEKDASAISKSDDLAFQRRFFANFSSNMVEVAMALKLSDSTIYIQYCPMKKAYWLSDNNAIRNPYYGSAMLTCGEVKETIN